MEAETYVTDEGLIDVMSLPAPQRYWVFDLAFTAGVGRLNLCGSYDVTFDELAALMEKGELPGVLGQPH